MNPIPSLHQCLVLHEIADGRVWWSAGQWWVTGVYIDHKVSLQVHKLIDYGAVVHDDAGLQVTEKGEAVLARRPLSELLERLNRPRR